MHNGYITIDNEKMSKSKGNFFTVRDILAKYSGEVIRFFLLSGHYRNPINFSEVLMEQAKNGLARMQNSKSNLIHLIHNGTLKMTIIENEKFNEFDDFRQKFIRAMDDDLNTADAITAIFELVTEINSSVKDGASKEFAEKSLGILLELTKVLGLLEDISPENDIDSELQILINEREEARKQKNFAKADEIRDILKEKGITLKDTPQGIQIIKE
jgi:cysteinyl-tRNA synthetase